MLGTDRSQLKASDAKITNTATGKSLAYSEIVGGQNVMETAPVGQAQLTPVSDWSVLGSPAAKVDGRAMVTGAHRYSSDQKLPGMLYGCIERSPALGATLDSVNDTVPERVVVVRDRDFVGVAATSPQQRGKQPHH